MGFWVSANRQLKLVIYRQRICSALRNVRILGFFLHASVDGAELECSYTEDKKCVHYTFCMERCSTSVTPSKWVHTNTLKPSLIWCNMLMFSDICELPTTSACSADQKYSGKWWVAGAQKPNSWEKRTAPSARKRNSNCVSHYKKFEFSCLVGKSHANFLVHRVRCGTSSITMWNSKKSTRVKSALYFYPYLINHN